MNRHQRRAQRATWRVFSDVAVTAVGFATPLHKAALAASRGEAGAAERFYEIADALAPDVKARLLSQLKHVDADREAVARRYHAEGRV